MQCPCRQSLLLCSFDTPGGLICWLLVEFCFYFIGCCGMATQLRDDRAVTQHSNSLDGGINHSANLALEEELFPFSLVGRERKREREGWGRGGGGGVRQADRQTKPTAKKRGERVKRRLNKTGTCYFYLIIYIYTFCCCVDSKVMH